MPIKFYKNFDLEKLLAKLENDEIQVLMAPDDEVGFYGITMDSDLFIVTKKFGHEDGEMLDWTRGKILDELGGRKVYNSIVASTGTDMGVLMEKYESRFE